MTTPTVAAMPGGSGGFLNRITMLEREVVFLKSKVEEDARWKGILEKWMLDNFVFDVRGRLIEATNPKQSFTKDKKKTQKTPPQPVRTTRLSRKILTQTRAALPSESEGEGNTDDDALSFDPADLIITPDIQDGSQITHHEHQMNCKIEQVSNPRDNEDCLSDIDYPGAVDGGDDDNDEDYDNVSVSSSSSSIKKRKSTTTMEWVLMATYPNLEAMRSSFPLRLWTGHGSDRTVTDGLIKKSYYCKECRRGGPVRLELRYRSPESEVEVFQNRAEHDHATKRTINEDMKVEILALYRAGMKSSTKIIEAMKISRPDLRIPTQKQVQHALKKTREQETKELAKEKKSKKEPAKKTKPKRKKGEPMLKLISGSTLASTLGMSGSGSGSQYAGGGIPNPSPGSSGRILNPLLLHQQQTPNHLGLIGYDVHAIQQQQLHSSVPLYTNNNNMQQQGLI